jgi:hypothetical protein
VQKSVQFSAQLRRVKEIERINPHAPTHNSPTVVASFTFDDKPTEPHMMVEVQPAAVDECEQMTSIDVQRVADILYHQSKVCQQNLFIFIFIFVLTHQNSTCFVVFWGLWCASV